MAGPHDLHDLAQELLEVCAEGLDAIPEFDLLRPTPDGLVGAPARQFVSPGAPVWDCCDMLAVFVNVLGDRHATPKALARLNVPTLIVTSTRCIPVGRGEGTKYRPPEVSAMVAAAKQIHADGWALWNHIYNAIAAEQFLGLCTEITFVSMTQVTPEGGCAGWQLAFQAVLDGYPSDFGT